MANVQTQHKGFQAGLKSPHGSRRHIEAATMTVTVALEEVRRRGYLHRDDMRSMTSAERNARTSISPSASLASPRGGRETKHE